METYIKKAEEAIRASVAAFEDLQLVELKDNYVGMLYSLNFAAS